MRKDHLWLVVQHVVARIIPVIAGGLIALLGDAGLLDGRTVEALRLALSG